jgi:hypothetical protein
MGQVTLHHRPGNFQYMLDLGGIKEVRWDKGERARAGDFIFY